MRNRKTAIDDRLDSATEDLINELGKTVRYERHLFAVDTGKRISVFQGPYSRIFYKAGRWLSEHRRQIQKAIIEDLDYGSKRKRYTRGHEALLVKDLARVLSPICKKADHIDPALVAVVLLRLGIDEFCKDYQSNRKQAGWSLETALGIDLDEAERAARKGSELLWQGKWQAAIPFYEKSLSRYAFNLLALNDMAYIYATYFPGHKNGIEYARRVLRNTPKGDPNDHAVLDTAGWALFRHNYNVGRAEELLREALSLLTPHTDGFISVVYHLMCVLRHLEKIDEFNQLWLRVRNIVPTNALDKEAYRSARALISGGKECAYPKEKSVKGKTERTDSGTS